MREPAKVAQAEASYRQALAMAEVLGMRPLQVHCHRGLGLLYAMTGQRADLHSVVHGHRDVHVDGYDLLAPPDGGSAGADGRTTTVGRAVESHRETFRPV